MNGNIFKNDLESEKKSSNFNLIKISYKKSKEIVKKIENFHNSDKKKEYDDEIFQKFKNATYKSRYWIITKINDIKFCFIKKK